MSRSLSYVYKVLPHASVNTIYYFPVPIPASHEFYPTEADAKVMPFRVDMNLSAEQRVEVADLCTLVL